MFWLKFPFPGYNWDNDYFLLLVPILFISGIGLLILKHYSGRIKALDSEIGLKYKTGINRTIKIKNNDHEKLQNSIKKIINITIRSRSLISRIHTEVISFDALIKSNKNLSEPDLLVITQLYNTIEIHRKELESLIEVTKPWLSERSLTLALKEYNIFVSTMHVINEFIISCTNKSWHETYSQLADQTDKHNKEIATIYQELTNLFQEELIGEFKE